MSKPVSGASWLGQWMRAEELGSMEKFERALTNRAVKKRLWEVAEQIPYHIAPLPTLDGRSILAGRAIDLSGELDCCLAWECRQRDIEKLFKRVWHYFDNIVIVGPSAASIRSAIERNNEDWALAKVRADAQLLFYLRDVGAEDIISFSEKPPACTLHIDDHAYEAGMTDIHDLIEIEAEHLKASARMSSEQHGSHLHYTFNHGLLEHTYWGTLDSVGIDDVELAICRDVATRFAAYLTSDMRAAKYHRLPLGMATSIHEDMLAYSEKEMARSNIAFELQLPILEGVSFKDLMALRRNELESFDAFRAAVTRAMDERISSRGDPRDTAQEIYDDVIKPAINDIALRMRSAASTLNKKNGINIALSIVTVLCGLRDISLMEAFLGITGLGVITAESEYANQRSEISVSDMYFLWRASRLKKTSMK